MSVNRQPRRWLRAALTVAVAGAALAVVPADAFAVDGTAAWAASWAYLPAGSGVALASGMLTEGGAAAPAGATVVLFAEPQDLTGASFSDVPLSRTTTDAAGKWSAFVPAGTDLTAYTDKASGKVNFAIRTFDAAGSDSYFLSADTTPSLATFRAIYPDAQAAGTAVVGGVTKQLATDPAESTGIAAESLATTAPSAQPSVVASSCSNFPLTTYHNRKTIIGATFDQANGTAVHFTFTAGSSSSLGVGVSSTNKAGTFKASGTQSKSSTVTANFPATHNIAYRNYYAYTAYTNYRVTCVGKGFATNSYATRPIGFDGGFATTAAPAKAMGKCTLVPAGTTVTKETSRAYTIGGGVDMSTVIGINLSAQTGYSTQTKIDFAMGAHQHPWCGLADYPGGSPQLMTIHP
jgi:hypothetical protein